MAEFLTPEKLVERWGGAVSIKTLARWRSTRRGPRFAKLEGSIVYALADIEAYEADQKRDGTRPS